MGTYWDNFISEYKQRILWEWNTKEMLKTFYDYLARQQSIGHAMEQSRERQEQQRADANKEG